jgi:hypothetical protein
MKDGCLRRAERGGWVGATAIANTVGLFLVLAIVVAHPSCAGHRRHRPARKQPVNAIASCRLRYLRCFVLNSVNSMTSPIFPIIVIGRPVGRGLRVP